MAHAAASVGGLTPDRFVGAAHDAFALARQRVGGSDVDIEVAGRRVRLSHAGPAFQASFERALAGRPLPAAETPRAPDLTVRLWDAATTGSPLDAGSWLGRWLGPAGIVEDLSVDGVRVSLDLHGTLVSAFDSRTSVAYHYAPDASRLPTWEMTHPARLLWAAWARANGMVLCHAAAVADRDSGLLIVGPSGAGKSTTALACRAAGMRWAGDDYVLVEAGPDPTAHALYRSASLEEEHAARHQAILAGAVELLDMGGGRRKAVMFDGAPGSAIGSSFRLAAVAVPRLHAQARTTFAPIGAGEALRALAPSTMTQLGAVDAETLRDLAAICRRLPCFRLELGRDVAGIAEGVQGLIGAAPAGAGAR